jgi:hypothetical protein
MRIAHQTTERLRLQTGIKHLSDAQVTELVALVSALPGVRGVAYRPATGSLVVEHGAEHRAAVAYACLAIGAQTGQGSAIAAQARRELKEQRKRERRNEKLMEIGLVFVVEHILLRALFYYAKLPFWRC